jgi:septal ring factor EnvC (AmiA/AmiB activator)
MSSSGERSDSFAATAVATQLFQTQSLIQTLLSEIRENSSLTANLNAELKNLRLNVNTLTSIVRGGDGNNRPLVLEVEMMKHADLHLDKRITTVMEDLEDQILSLAKNLSEASARVDTAKKELEAKIELADKQRRDWETAKLQADVATNNDIRLDGRTRFATWASIVIAIISMIGTILALSLK